MEAQVTLSREDSTRQGILYMSLELGKKNWKVFSSCDGRQIREKAVPAGDLLALDEEVKKAKERFGLLEDALVRSCYEASHECFWLHRFLTQRGIENVVVDPSSMEVRRRKRRAKTDRLDGRGLLRGLLRYHGGEEGVWSVVRVPTEEQEDDRRLHRELEVLTKEATAHKNRIRGLLLQEGIRGCNPDRRDFLQRFEQLRSWDGRHLAGNLRGQIVREYERLQCVKGQIAELEKAQRAAVEAQATPNHEMIVRLQSLYAIGMKTAWCFTKEFFWREFHNRKEVGALSGLAPSPYISGEMAREQGITKAGNARIRRMAIEVAWRWVYWQPDSALTRWFNERFASGGKRMRRVGIVALARKLLIQLWRYITRGELPEGARVKAAL